NGGRCQPKPERQSDKNQRRNNESTCFAKTIRRFFAANIRTAVDDGEDEPREPEKSEKQTAEEDRRDHRFSTRESSPDDAQFAEERPERRAGRNRKQSDDKNARGDGRSPRH